MIIIALIVRSVQLGPERRGGVNQHPHPHKPHRPSLQGRYSGTHLQIPASVSEPLRALLDPQQSIYTGALYKTDSPKYQAVYDQLVQSTGCTLASDTLECLRAAPYAILADAVDNTTPLASSNGLDLTWGVSIDGELIQKSLNQYISEGCYAKVPILAGQVDDEGT